MKKLFSGFKENTLTKARQGVGGILMLLCTAICAFTMINVFAFVKDTTARSVAESTEHVIALHLLASFYTENESHINEIIDEGKEYNAINGTTYKPLKEFNDTMVTYKLMAPNGRSEKMAIEYEPAGKDLPTGVHSGATVQIQASEFIVYGNSTVAFYNDTDSGGTTLISASAIPSTVTPDPSQVVIEEN